MEAMSVLSPLPILVVDDEEMALTLVTRLLERIGFTEIDTAANGVQARARMAFRARPRP